MQIQLKTVKMVETEPESDVREVAVAAGVAGVLHQGAGGPGDGLAAALQPAFAVAGLLLELDAVDVVPLVGRPDVLPDRIRVVPDLMVKKWP